MRNHIYSLALLGTLMAGLAYAGLTADEKFKLNQGYGANTQLGTKLDQPGSLSVVWNASTGNLGSSTLRSGVRSAGTANAGPAGVHNLGVSIPKQSLVTRAWVEITDSPITLDSTNAAGFGLSPGLSFHCSTKTTGLTTVDLSSSTLYADTVGLADLTAVDTIATMQRNASTEDCAVQVQVHGNAHTSGKVTLFIEYMQIR